MKTQAPATTLGGGVVAAALLAAAGAALLALLGPLAGAQTAARLVVALLGFAYVLYVLGQAQARVGRVTAVAIWMLVATTVWAAGLSWPYFVLVHVAMAWLVRALYLRANFVAALADLGLCVLGLALAVWAGQRTGSAFLAFWCLFFTQAFHVEIPAALGARASRNDEDTGLAFERAHRAADAALRRASTSR